VRIPHRRLTRDAILFGVGVAGFLYGAVKGDPAVMVPSAGLLALPGVLRAEDRPKDQDSQ